MSVFEETALIDKAFKQYLFVPSDDKTACIVVDKDTLTGVTTAFHTAHIHPYFVNLLLAAPTLYQELSRQVDVLEHISNHFERQPGVSKQFMKQFSDVIKSAELALALARDGVNLLADAMKGEPV